MSKQLYRSNEKILAGVCSGIAEYFEVDPTIVRIIWLLSCFVGGIGLVAYIVCWLVMPAKSFSPFGTSSRNLESSPTRENATRETSSPNKEKSKQIFGIALIVIGSIFMLDKAFRWFNMDIIIPLGIIALGVYILFHARRG